MPWSGRRPVRAVSCLSRPRAFRDGRPATRMVCAVIQAYRPAGHCLKRRARSMKTFPEGCRLVGRSRPGSDRDHFFIALVLGAVITSAAAGQTGKRQPDGKPGTLILFDGKSLG